MGGVSTENNIDKQCHIMKNKIPLNRGEKTLPSVKRRFRYTTRKGDCGPPLPGAEEGGTESPQPHE